MVFVTIPQKDAHSFAESLVQHCLAACVNILPGVQSIYTWEDQICTDAESLLLIKTSTVALPKLRHFVLTEHPYETPEFVVVEVKNEESSQAYLNWVLSNTEINSPS